MTLYLLDANVLIRSHGDYYPRNRIPQFWAWLLAQSKRGLIKMPSQIYKEVSESADSLGEWLREKEVRSSLVLDGLDIRHTYQDVLTRGYAPDLDESELPKVGRDPFLIAAALKLHNSCVVTKEVSSPKKCRANRKIPDVCNQFGVRCVNDFVLYKELNFFIPAAD